MAPGGITMTRRGANCVLKWTPAMLHINHTLLFMIACIIQALLPFYSLECPPLSPHEFSYTAAPSYADSPKMIPFQCNFHAITRSSTMTPLTLSLLFQHHDRVLPAKLPRLRFTSSSAKATSLLQPPHQTTWGLHPRTPASASRPGLSASSVLRLLIRASLCMIKF